MVLVKTNQYTVYKPNDWESIKQEIHGILETCNMIYPENDFMEHTLFCECQEQMKPSIYKASHGEVFTPHDLVYHMLSQLPIHLLKNKNTKWLDTGSGRGHFAVVLYAMLKKNTMYTEPNELNHIIDKRIHMVELNPINVSFLKSMFTCLHNTNNTNTNNTNNTNTNNTPKFTNMNMNIICDDFLNLGTSVQPLTSQYDVIIGNPPYHVNGQVKVPTNTNKDQHKYEDGQTMWTKFVKHAYTLLKPGGYLVYIIPSMWCRPDKAMMYDFMTQNFNIKYVECFSNTETNRYFSKQAQTPTTIFVGSKLLPSNYDTPIGRKQIPVYDRINHQIIPFSLEPGKCIPMRGVRICDILQTFVLKYGSLHQYITKTNMPSSSVRLAVDEAEHFIYPNIHTAKMVKSVTTNSTQSIQAVVSATSAASVIPVKLEIKYSNNPCVFANVAKVVLPHKMYGIPYYDCSGHFGISNRDNYVFHLPETGEHVNDVLYRQYTYFLSTPFVQFILSCGRYRMMVFDKCILEYIPCIHKCSSFPSMPYTNNELMEYFGLNNDEQEYINTQFRSYQYV